MPKTVKEIIANFWSTSKAAEAARKDVKNHYYNSVKQALAKKDLQEAARLVSECPCYAAKAECYDLLRRYSITSGEVIITATQQGKGDAFGNNAFPITVR